MLQAFVITLREGFEAFLIVAISLAYLRKAGRHSLTPAVHWGVAASLALNAANQEWLDGPLAMVAAISVAWLVIHMWRAGRFMKGSIEGHLRDSSVRSGIGAFVGVFLFTVLMVTREGMETVLLLLQLKDTLNLAAGAAAGVMGAAFVAWLWSRFGQRVNLALFFQVTAIFLFVFVVQLSVYGIHEMSEQNFLPFSAVIHEWTESWGPDSSFGHMLTYLLVILPASWLIVSSTLLRGGGRSKRVMPQQSAAR
jgi:high-affinity iron transporter